MKSAEPCAMSADDAAVDALLRRLKCISDSHALDIFSLAGTCARDATTLIQSLRAENRELKKLKALYSYADGTERSGFSSDGVNLEGRRSDIDAVVRWHHSHTAVVPYHNRVTLPELVSLRVENARLRTAFRVNMLRLAPETTHAEIDRIIAGDDA